MKDVEQMIYENNMSRPLKPFLLGTVPVFGCIGSMVVATFIFVYRLIGPTVAARYAELNGTTPPPATEFQWLNWVIVFAILVIGAVCVLWFISVFRVAENGVEVVDGVVDDEPQRRPLLRSGR